MATTNLYQNTRIEHLNVEALFKNIIYKPKLIGLGTGQGSWTPVPYAHAQKDILKISIDEMQQQPNSIADNVFRRIGISAKSEEIHIQPLVLEIVESGFQKRNAEDVIPLVLTELNQIFDKMNAKSLKGIAKKGQDITWTCAPAFVNSMVEKLSEYSHDMVKVLIIPNTVNIALNCIGNFAETRHWYEELKNRMQRLNTEVMVSSVIGEEVYMIQKPLLAEYQGYFPCVHQEGFDERAHEYWMQFVMSNTDFKVRVPEAVEVFEVKSLNMTQISVATCPT